MDDYETAAKIGQGTFGVVTKAKERVGGKMVALKKLVIHETQTRDGVSYSALCPHVDMLTTDPGHYRSRNQDSQGVKARKHCSSAVNDRQERYVDTERA